MSDANKALASRFIEEFWNQGNFDVVDEIMGLNYVNYNPPPGIPVDRDGYKEWGALFRSAFPDQQAVAEDIIAEGDLVVIRWSTSGTHQGEFMGIPPTGKRISLAGITIMRVDDGLFIEDWTEMDAIGLMQQLGAIPAPGQ